MPNIATVLKQEIARIARKETRNQVASVRKATTQHRRHIALLKSHVTMLERRIASLTGRIENQRSTATPDASDPPIRFQPKGLRSVRNRLGLSAADFAKLVGVTAQSIYNWEREVTRPRKEQLKVLAEVRAMGKRDVKARLAAVSTTRSGKPAAG
jgi:DNA-binding transcriptional regulator YiaG